MSEQQHAAKRGGQRKHERRQPGLVAANSYAPFEQAENGD
jgi:hypothetical protein